MITKPKPQAVDKFLTKGDPNAPILVVTDVPSHKGFEAGVPVPRKYYELFAYYGAKNGFSFKDFQYVTPCPPFPAGISENKTAQNEWIKAHHQEFLNVCSNLNPKAIVAFGAHAAQQCMNKPVKITRVRGVVTLLPTFQDKPMVAIMSPGQVLRQPRHALSFRADYEMVRQLRNAKYDPTNLKFDTGMNYRWVDSYELETYLQQCIKNRKDPARALPCSMDTETVGGQWYENCQPIMAQLSFVSGEGVALALDEHLCARVIAPEGTFSYPDEEDGDYRKVDNMVIHKPKAWTLAKHRAKAMVARNREVFKRLMEEEYHPMVWTGQNFKYDIHVCTNAGIRINTDSWEHDTMQLSFVMDENIQSKDLASLTRIWIPPLAGYSDKFEATVNYAHMDQVEHDKIMQYGCADTDTTIRLTKRLVPDAMQDEKQYNCYERIQMPALRMFADVERRGIQIDVPALRKFGEVMKDAEEEKYQELIDAVHGEIKLKHFDDKNKNRKGLSFTRAALVIDQLFEHPKGLRLEPKMWTPSGQPSVSSKNHLPHFEHQTWIADFMEWQKIQKLLTTYIGSETAKTGIWQYIALDGCIRPSYMLHRTVTGRTASNNPNGQNFPKHGKLAKEYRKIFIPHKGYSFLEVDLSQAELRIAAWMAKEKTMIRIYREGGDIHAATGAAIAEIPIGKFYEGQKDGRLLLDCANEWKGSGAFLQSLSPGARKVATVKLYMKEIRQRAKAVNFGFLYGMGWKKFSAYAKTTYQVTISDEQAQDMRNKFFQMYPGLKRWHIEMRKEVNKTGFVRALHGAKRHLQDIFSVDEGIRMATERQAVNSPVQRFASDLALMGAIRLHRDLRRSGNTDAHIVAFIHDAVIIEVKQGKEKEFASYLKWYMETIPLDKWFGIKAPLPLISDITCCKENLGQPEDEELWKDTQPIKPVWFTSDTDSGVSYKIKPIPLAPAPAPVKPPVILAKPKPKIINFAKPVAKSRLRGDDEPTPPARKIELVFKKSTRLRE